MMCVEKKVEQMMLCSGGSIVSLLQEQRELACVVLQRVICSAGSNENLLIEHR